MNAPNVTPWTKDPDLRVVLSTAPPDAAQALAVALVESGAAACVNLVPGVRSVYRWAGAISNDPETLLVIKTRTAALPALQATLWGNHTYEIPEIVALAVSGASADYAAWVAEAAPGVLEKPPDHPVA